MSLYDRYQEIRDFTMEVLKDIQAIEFCPAEDGYYHGLIECSDELYALATNKAKEIKPDFNDFKLFHECIKSIMSECGIDTMDEHMNNVHFKD